MPTEFEKNLEKYAEVAVKVALNVQPGQNVLIGRPAHGVYGIPIELAPLVRPIVKKCYEVGAKLVDVIRRDHLDLNAGCHQPLARPDRLRPTQPFGRAPSRQHHRFGSTDLGHVFG